MSFVRYFISVLISIIILYIVGIIIGAPFSEIGKALAGLYVPNMRPGLTTIVLDNFWLLFIAPPAFIVSYVVTLFIYPIAETEYTKDAGYDYQWRY